MSKKSEYNFYINDIIYNEEFLKLKECRHHGITRLEHSLRVSYISYSVAKLLKLDYKSTARAGLLHDYYIDIGAARSEVHRNIFKHPSIAVNNSIKEYNLNNIEKDIIISHMFPLVPVHIPKYTESWIVSTVDKFVASYEFLNTFMFKYKIVNRLAVIFLLIITRR